MADVDIFKLQIGEVSAENILKWLRTHPIEGGLMVDKLLTNSQVNETDLNYLSDLGARLKKLAQDSTAFGYVEDLILDPRENSSSKSYPRFKQHFVALAFEIQNLVVREQLDALLLASRNA